MTPFAGWQNFYVIVGSSAGALIGLQFVVMTLIAEMSIERDLQRAAKRVCHPDHRSFRDCAAPVCSDVRALARD